MKILLLVLSIAFAGCGPKSNEDIAKDLVKEKLRTTIPDFDNSYEAINFGTLGTAFLPYEETDQSVKNGKALNDLKDSISLLEKTIKENKSAAASTDYKKRLQQLTDREQAKIESNSEGKQSYTPEKLFKITHAYKLKDKSGMQTRTEEEFYFNKELTKVLKSHKVY